MTDAGVAAVTPPAPRAPVGAGSCLGMDAMEARMA
jgi:hypothetical protein